MQTKASRRQQSTLVYARPKSQTWTFEHKIRCGGQRGIPMYVNPAHWGVAME